MYDFEFAKDKVLMGAERRSMIVTDEEKRVTAIHEAGHALLGVLLPHADPMHKVTIIPRGMALGLTQQLPTDEKHNYSRDYLMDQIAILLGGRIAEELTTGEITTGAGNDLERATELARRMVCEWGMSEALGPLTFGKKEEQIFLGREIAQHQDYSEDTALKIDAEVKRIITDNYERAHRRARPSTSSVWWTSPTRCSRARCSTPTRSAASLTASRWTKSPPPLQPPPTVGDGVHVRREKERPSLVPPMPKPLHAGIATSSRSYRTWRSSVRFGDSTLDALEPPDTAKPPLAAYSRASFRIPLPGRPPLVLGPRTS